MDLSALPKYPVCLFHGPFYAAHLREQHNNWEVVPWTQNNLSHQCLSNH